MQQTIMFVIGTRPDLIKMAPLILEAKARPDIHPVICSTGQHKEMLASLYKLFDFEPDVDFKLMKPNQSLIHLHSETMIWMSETISKYKPSWVVVNGDTTTAHAAAMAAFYLKVPVAHVEAGLRTYDINSPFPEEMNRRAVGLVAKVHLCPTPEAAQNLQNEKIDAASSIKITGNTVIDSLHFVSKKIDSQPDLTESFRQKYAFLLNREFILVTMHRRENFGDAQHEVLRAFLDIVKNRKIDILFPVHPNPNVRTAVNEIYQNEYGHYVHWINETGNPPTSEKGRILLTDPFDYPDFVYNMKNCKFLMTDSGGLQEEAPSFAKKLLVLRQSTERPEGVEAGFSQIVGTERRLIVQEALKLIDAENYWESRIPPINPYGDGFSSGRIMGILARADHS